MKRLRDWVGSHLHRRIFLLFGIAILVSGTVSALVFAIAPARPGWGTELQRLKGLAGQQYAAVWDQPEERDELSRLFAHELDLSVTVLGTDGSILSHHGEEQCHGRAIAADVARAGSRVGRVEFCRDHSPFGALLVVLSLFLSALALWALSMKAARKLTMPLHELVGVANAIGEGDLGARADADRRHGEVHELAKSINTMAGRIEKQLGDQKELLAAVSHEIRTPLGHMRILLDGARDKGHDKLVLDEIEAEVMEVDALVGQLLANSRLEFDSIQRRELSARELAERALERAGLGAELLVVELVEEEVNADPTLLARALANLLTNAQKHGGEVRRLRIFEAEGTVRFEVTDAGPGFDLTELDQVFEPFFRGKARAGAGSLGLGLALVRRIAEAHGGTAWARNQESGGAVVGLSVRNTERGPAAPN